MSPLPDISTSPAPGMRWIPGGTFAMGSEDFYPEERPVHRVSVDGFWMDETPVTAAQFRRFVRETKYVTLAERPLDAAAYPDADPELLVPGSLVFRRTAGPGRPERPPQLVGVRAGRVLEATGREGNDDQRPRHASRRPYRIRGRRGVRGVGREGASDARRSGSSPHAAGSTARSSPGATSTSRTARRWRTRGRASFPGRT